jgi:hypothetical protein
METEKVYAMPFAKIYPILVAKAVGKGRTQAEVDKIIGWLTGYSACGVKLESIEEPLMKEIRYLDKLVDELAKGKAMEKIKRTNK